MLMLHPRPHSVTHAHYCQALKVVDHAVLQYIVPNVQGGLRAEAIEVDNDNEPFNKGVTCLPQKQSRSPLLPPPNGEYCCHYFPNLFALIAKSADVG